MNGLYGKFGQLSKRWEEAPQHRNGPTWGTWFSARGPGELPHRLRSLAGRPYLSVPGDEAEDSCPAIAAHVTAYGRQLMDGCRVAAGPHTVYHQYVDSLVVSRTGLNALTTAGLVDAKRLGKLRVVGESEFSWFHSPGDYLFGGKAVVAGVSRKASVTATGRYTQTEFESVGALMDRPLDGTVIVREELRRLRREPPPGTVGKDGWITPVRIEEAQ
jgi:hypothetical protein